MTEDYYNILGVEKNASQSEIKKAFRKKAQQYHPDKKDGDESKFKEVNEAYSTLSDEGKRKQYDTYGSASSGMGGGASGDGFSGQGFDFSGFQGGGFNSQGFDFEDIFSQFGGGGRGREKRGDDLVLNVKITFEDSVFGIEKTFTLDKDKICSDCAGTGAKNKKVKKCSTCDGQGKVHQTQQTIFGTSRVVKECDNCMGTGEVPEDKCGTCHGQRIVKAPEEVNIKIPSGVEDGSRLRVKDKGGVVIGGLNGDLYINIEIEYNSKFQKDGYNILSGESVSLIGAVLGAEKEIGVVGGKLKIKIPAGTNSGDILKVKKQGFVISGKDRGDMYLTLNVIVPKRISKKERELFEELRDLGK